MTKGISVPWDIGFQSSMCWGKWLGPTSESVVKSWAKKGIRSLLVATPGFITPHSETLIDVDERLKAIFLENGGTTFRTLPPLCCYPTFIRRLCESLLFQT